MKGDIVTSKIDVYDAQRVSFLQMPNFITISINSKAHERSLQKGFSEEFILHNFSLRNLIFNILFYIGQLQGNECSIQIFVKVRN